MDCELSRGNPSSTYKFGAKLKSVIETAREQVAELIGAHPMDVILTSCATESNNAAIAAALQDFPANRPDGPKPSIFMSRTPIQSEDMRRKALYSSGQ